MSTDTVEVYSHGLIYCSVCAPLGWTTDMIEARVNTIHPTGIGSEWSIAHENFADGSPNPAFCSHGNEGKLHWLLSC